MGLLFFVMPEMVILIAWSLGMQSFIYKKLCTEECLSRQ